MRCILGAMQTDGPTGRWSLADLEGKARYPMTEGVLTLHARPSAIRFAVFRCGPGAELDLKISGSLDDLYGDATFQAFDGEGACVASIDCADDIVPGHGVGLEFLLNWLQEHLRDLPLGIVGHQLAHGGTRFAAPVRVDEATLADLETLTLLASGWQSEGLRLIRLVAERRPAPAQVACFDSAFHASVPPSEQVFALPWSITEQGIRPYGLHGLLCEQVASFLPDFDERAAVGRTIVLHLDTAGPSLCALAGGRSVAATSAFSDQDGLPAETRCGPLDPSVLLVLIESLGLDVQAAKNLLYRESGLLGVSGVSADFAVLLASRKPRARLAVELFLQRITRELGALAATLAGIDALVFTAVAGKPAARMRGEICRRASWLGVELDPAANEAGGPRVTRKNSRVSAWVIPTNVDLMIARQSIATLRAARWEAPRIE